MVNPTTVISPGSSFTVSIAASGIPLQVFWRPGDGRPFVAGVPGARYIITVRNNSAAQKLLAVVSVDGRNVLEDEAASQHESSGMIIHPCQSYRFWGWRLNDDETAPFIFGDPGDSISAQATGSDSNTGVIGVSGFLEKPKPAVYSARHVSVLSPHPARPRGMSAGGQGMSIFTTSTSTGTGTGTGTWQSSPAESVPVASAAAGGVDYDLGTGMGSEVQHDPVGRAPFDRSGITPDTVTIGYATYRSLVAARIIPGTAGPGDRDPFPGNRDDDTGYGKYLTW